MFANWKIVKMFLELKKKNNANGKNAWLSRSTKSLLLLFVHSVIFNVGTVILKHIDSQIASGMRMMIISNTGCGESALIY